jgi:hypothetical protein
MDPEVFSTILLPTSGVHDLARTETWVCAICRFYDPPAKEAPPTTEWIGCDCNRWYLLESRIQSYQARFFLFYTYL